MTDADVDGSHIRTLLLTFFFRHMKPLITGGHIFVAQPPLYLVSRRKHKEYVRDEGQMRSTLMKLGLENATLEIRDNSNGKPEIIASYTGAKLAELVGILDELADKARIVERRGLSFEVLLSHRDAEGKLPTHWMVVEGRNVFFHGQEKYDEFMAKRAERLAADDEEENGNVEAEADEEEAANLRRVHKRAQLHEAKDIDRIIGKLAHRGISMEDYFIEREQSVTGEWAPAKYVLLSDDDVVELDNVSAIAPGIRNLGSRGIEIKRFKGLGEMNAEELWETTMDPERRVLLRVRADEAEEAERMFSLLMGDNVERRRQFIEDNALSVKNLDV